MMFQFKRTLLSLSFLIFLLMGFFTVTQYPQDSEPRVPLIAPFAKTAPKSLFDEPVYVSAPSPIAAVGGSLGGIPDDGISEVGGCNTSGPTWVDLAPETRGMCWPQSCGVQQACTQVELGKRCREGTKDNCVCRCAVDSQY